MTNRQELYRIEEVFSSMLDIWYSKMKPRISDKPHQIGNIKETIKRELDNQFNILAKHADAALEENQITIK